MSTVGAPPHPYQSNYISGYGVFLSVVRSMGFTLVPTPLLTFFSNPGSYFIPQNTDSGACISYLKRDIDIDVFEMRFKLCKKNSKSSRDRLTS